MNKRQLKKQETIATLKLQWKQTAETVVNPEVLALIEETETKLIEEGKEVYPFLRKYDTRYHRAKI